MFGLFRKKDPNKDRNDAVRAGLAARGDDGTAPRLVRHHVSPTGAGQTNATVVREYLAMNGLEVSDGAGEALIAAERREVASAAFDAHTERLAHAVQEWHWSYDGWDSAGAAEDPREAGETP